MKKIEVAIYLILAASLAALKMYEIIDEASIAWAIGVIGLARVAVYQRNEISRHKEEKEALMEENFQMQTELRKKSIGGGGIKNPPPKN